MSRLLLVDDDQALNSLLTEYLSQEGFEVINAYDGKQALDSLTQEPDLMVLDVMMPELNGIEVLKQLRQKDIQLPILMLTAKGDDLDRILGLELGADDYLAKPCNPRELLARINAILRRSHVNTLQNSRQKRPIDMNQSRLEAYFRGQEITLTGAEFKLLWLLNERVGKITKKDFLSEQGLGRKLTRYDRSIDVHLSNIRKKLVAMGARDDILVNQRGAGYLLKADEF
ncbi:response regulator [Bermanella marisrubri]|uniref:Two component system response regulatory protein n=1 Tax=Bermanella marisrubri TaxID=207949 RepID=Q1N329_9GAMM|nr:response regulator [Bermanella marisrubri]EAT12762.1 two component system response regulatory protein [Oceanobacter sp. RED65] [Bermanella marisrubri]QIZ85122.1 response regulator [Bermanella marisrubri]